MKHTLAFLLAIVMTLSLLAGCGETKGGAGDAGGAENATTTEPVDGKEPADDTSEDEEPGDAEDAEDGEDGEDAGDAGDAGDEELPAPEETPVTAPDLPESTPAAAPDLPGSAPEPNAPAPDAPPAAGVDLAAFYDAVRSKYEMAAMEDISGVSDLLDNFYAGLSGIATRQSLVCVAMMTGVVCEIALIEVADGADVEAVKAILQDRIDYQIESGAYYPAAVEGWTNNSRIVTNGNYVMMVAHQDCDSIVSDFNALF